MGSPWRFLPCPKCCGCRACAVDTPESFDVTIAGIADDVCTDCTDLNATYVLDRVTWVTPLSCYWLYNFTSGPCGASSIELTIWRAAAAAAYPSAACVPWAVMLTEGHYYLAVKLSASTNLCRCLHWLYDFGTTKPDCGSLAGLAVPFLGGVGEIAWECSTAGATCTVSA